MKKDRIICTLLAKAGHKVQGDKNTQAEWIMSHYDDEKIEKYELSILSGIQQIIDEDCVIDDLVSLPEQRVISLDYDFKRYPISECDTRPIKDINEFKKARQSVDYLRRLGQRASINAVDYKYQRAKQNVRKTGSNKAFCARHILRGLIHEVTPFKKINKSYPQIAILLQEYGVTLSRIKHAKGARFASNMIADTSANRSYIRKILKLLEIESESNYKEFLSILLHKKISNPEEVSYLDN